MAGTAAHRRKVLERRLAIQERAMILAEWYVIHPVAWSNYQKHGRGLIILEPQEDGITWKYLPEADLARLDPDGDALAMVRRYRPQTEVVCLFARSDGASCHLVRSPRPNELGH